MQSRSIISSSSLPTLASAYFFLKVTHYLTKSSASVCRYHSISTAFVSHAMRKGVVKMNFGSRFQDRRFGGNFILLLILEYSSFIFTITHNL